jgi:hypothetical protein
MPDYELDPLGRLEVDRGQWKHLRGEGTLFTSNIMTYIGIALYNRSERLAFLGHFDHDAFSNDDGRFRSMIIAASGALLTRPGNHIWMGGGETLEGAELSEAIEVANAETESAKVKAYKALEVFMRAGAGRETDWLKSPGYSLSYSIDVATGEENISRVRSPQ